MKTMLSLVRPFLALVALFFAFAPLAQSADTPTTAKGVTIISPADAKALSGAKFYDVRNAANFGKGHLPAAVFLPSTMTSEDTAEADLSKDTIDLTKLPADKNAKIVFYGHGANGWKAYKGSLIAVREGYKSVLWMRTGFADWESKGFPVEK